MLRTDACLTAHIGLNHRMPQPQESWDEPGSDRNATYRMALSQIQRRLIAPRAPLAYPYVATNPSGEVMDINLTMLSLRMWINLDQAIAEQLFQGVVTQIEPEGRLPASKAISGETSPIHGAYPLLAQCALDLVTATKNLGPLRTCLPALTRYIQWTHAYYPLNAAGHPQWPSREEAYISETYQQGAAGVELATFLICDALAFERLCELSSSSLAALDEIQAYRQNLEQVLLRDYWSTDQLAFRGLDASGTTQRRGTIASLTPLRWEGLPESHRRSLRQEALSGSGYMTEHGLRQWIPQPDDAEAPPVSGYHQLLLLDTIGSELAQRTLIRIESYRNEMGALPNLIYGTPRRDDAKATTIATAAAYIRAHQIAHPQAENTISEPVRWLERHHKVVIALLIVAMASVTLGTGVYLMNKRTIIHSSIRPTVGLALQHYDEGRFEEAEKLYRALLSQAKNTTEIEFRLANTLYQQGKLNEAAEHYRKALQSDSASPKAMLNLGLTLYRLGDTEEAKHYYETFLVHHGHKHPELTARAETAIEIISITDE